MADTILIDALFSGFAEGFCPTGPGALTALAEAIIDRTQWSLPVNTRFFNYGETEPTPEFRGYPWFRTLSGYPDRWYVYTGAAQGPSKWLSLHPVPVGPNGLREFWVGTEDELLVYDGGEVGIATLSSGPFWEIDHDFDGRSPMGPGVILGANPAKTLSVGENYGEGAHTQTAEEVGPHTHEMSPKDIEVAPGSGTSHGFRYEPTATGDPHPDLVANINAYTTSQEASPIIHPVRGMWIIKRTIRKYYRSV